MDKKRVGTKPQRITKTSIRTTVLDLLEELTALTKDDTLVIAVMKNILPLTRSGLRVRSRRFASFLAPYRSIANMAQVLRLDQSSTR